MIDKHALPAPSFVRIHSAGSIIISVQHLEFSRILDPILRQRMTLYRHMQEISPSTQRQVRYVEVHVSAAFKREGRTIDEIGRENTDRTLIPIHHYHHAHIIESLLNVASIVHPHHEMLARERRLDRL